MSLSLVAAPRDPVRMGRPPRKPADRAAMVEMGRRLYWVRAARGLTQAEMAQQVGVHQTAWSLYERGLRWPDQFEVPRLAAKLQITLEYLRGGSLEGVEPSLAIRLAAAHPELVDQMDRGRCTGKRRA